MSPYTGFKMWPLMFLIVWVSGVYSGHSLRHYLTAVSSPGHGMPEFSMVGYVDGIQIENYNSDRGRAVPVARWMEKAGPEYWEGQTQKGRRLEADLKFSARTLMSRFNQTEGVHFFQVRYGCELSDDGSTTGYDQHGYDGRDFVVLNTSQGVYIPIIAEAQTAAQRLNSPEVQAGKGVKYYLSVTCIEMLKKHIKNGREELERRVPPQIKILDQTSNGTTKLQCQVYGFYPRDVGVNWKKNGSDVPSREAKQVLPNTDGTYQIRVTVEVTPEEGDSYSCHVDHGSLAEPLIVMWDPRTGRSGSAVSITVGAIALIGAAAVVGFIIWKRYSGKKPDYDSVSSK
ncbi:class I histocompatibility antigen, F10 alpha chain-like [Spea bombifrons]|uniref:class I histocompatibility antigen, F10 alpha chain-like n=1 Tax=Spea bombifrons TaxID=233779 RepID=UPI00234A657B|nr:class I histocompatibility antigen, F10 alpha chain-like [Spea bombifrons]